MRTLAVTALLLVISMSGSAQNENRVWLFNDTTGLDFATDPPTVLHNTGFFGGDAVAVIGDANGQLVLVADEMQVMNAQYQVLVNGGNLNPDWNQNRDGIFLPWPGHPGQYYLVQTRLWNQNYPDAHAVYHRIDLNGGGGIGEVVERDIVLSDSAAAYMTAVVDAEGTGIWLILHHTSRPLFMAYHLDADGLSATPAISEVGPPIEPWYYQGTGFLRPSLNGDRLYLKKFYTTSSDARIHLMDFDRATGLVSGFFTIDENMGGPGLEISRSGQFLYTVTRVCDYDLGIASRLWQYDLSSGDSATIHDSKTLLFEAPITPGGCIGQQGDLVLGTDGRIYCAVSNAEYLGVINYPDLPAPGCDYVHEGLYLEGDHSWLWLPNQMREYPVENPTSGSHGSTPVLANMAVRPIPAAEGCWITLPDVGVQRITLLDGLGRCTRDLPRPVGQRDVRLDRLGLASGLYSVVARDRHGRIVATGRVVFE